MTALTIVMLLVLPRVAAPHFEQMFRELGGEMPALTRFVLSFWGAPVLSIIPLGCMSTALFFRRSAPIGERRILLVVAFGLTVVGSAIYLLGLYLPIFTIADQIQ